MTIATGKLNWEKFKPKFHESWHRWMKDIIESKEVWDIYQFLKSESRDGIVITPESKNIFKSFETDLDKLLVIIMGQDPYPQIVDGVYVANGRAFCCANTGRLQKSLGILYQGIEEDCYNGLKLDYTMTPDLSYLESQGVMLTNASLTCPVGKPGEYEELWEPFWKLVFERIFSNYPGLVFIFMGNKAMAYAGYLDLFVHHELHCEHPIAASYAQRDYRHNKVFSKTNQLLKENNNYEISWLLENPPF